MNVFLLRFVWIRLGKNESVSTENNPTPERRSRFSVCVLIRFSEPLCLQERVMLGFLFHIVTETSGSPSLCWNASFFKSSNTSPCRVQRSWTSSLTVTTWSHFMLLSFIILESFGCWANRAVWTGIQTQLQHQWAADAAAFRLVLWTQLDSF